MTDARNQRTCVGNDSNRQRQRLDPVPRTSDSCTGDITYHSKASLPRPDLAGPTIDSLTHEAATTIQTTFRRIRLRAKTAPSATAYPTNTNTTDKDLPMPMPMPPPIHHGPFTLTSHPGDTIMEVINPTHLMNNQPLVITKSARILALTETCLSEDKRGLFDDISRVSKWEAKHSPLDPTQPQPHAGTTLMARRPR